MWTNAQSILPKAKPQAIAMGVMSIGNESAFTSELLRFAATEEGTQSATTFHHRHTKSVTSKDEHSRQEV